MLNRSGKDIQAGAAESKTGEGKRIPEKAFAWYEGSTSFIKDIVPGSLFWFLPGEPGSRCRVGIENNPASLKVKMKVEGVPVLLRILGNVKPRAFRKEGIAAKGRMKTGSGIDWKSLDAKGRYDALVSLEKLGKVGLYAGEVENLLQDEDEAVAARAAYALGKFKVKAAVPLLIRIARDSGKKVLRRYSVYALMKIGDNRAETVFLEKLKDPDPVARGLAATGLEKIKSRKAGKAIGRSLFNSVNAPSQVKVRLLKAMAHLGGPEDVYELLLSIGPKDPREVVEAGVYALERITPTLPSEREVSLLCHMLDHPVYDVRRYAVERLAELGSADAIGPLKERLKVEGPKLANLLGLAIRSIEDKNKLNLTLSKAIEKTTTKVGSFRQKIGDFIGTVKTWPAWKKGVLAGILFFLVVLLVALKKLYEARRAKETAEKVASLVDPSEGLEAYQQEGQLREEEEEPWNRDQEPEVLDLDLHEDDDGSGGEAGQLDLDDGEDVEAVVPSEEEDMFLKPGNKGSQ